MILAIRNYWCMHISWRNTYRNTPLFWVFAVSKEMKYWNYGNKYHPPPPPYYFNSPIEVYPPKNLRKKFVPTKFWQVFKLSPLIILRMGQKPWFNCLWDTEPLQGDSFLCVTKFQDFLIFIWLTKEGSKSESAWSHPVFLILRTLFENPTLKPLGHCLWSKGSRC